MKEPTAEQIAKLPSWAREHIESITRRMDNALIDVQNYRNEQAPSPFYQEYQGESRREKRYIQAHNIVVEWRGVRLRVEADDYGNTGVGIRLQWEDQQRHGRDVAFIPKSFQYACLVAKGDMS